MAGRERISGVKLLLRTCEELTFQFKCPMRTGHSGRLLAGIQNGGGLTGARSMGVAGFRQLHGPGVTSETIDAGGARWSGALECRVVPMCGLKQVL